MQALCPKGPYSLTGYCLSAAIAFEMACQLVRRGESISRLILLDPVDPANSMTELVHEPPSFWLRRNGNRVLFHLQETAKRGTNEMLTYFMQRVKAILTRLKGGLSRRWFKLCRDVVGPLPTRVRHLRA